MNRKLLIFTCILGILIVLLVSCQTDPEEKRSVITVAAINDNLPVFSDVLEQGDSVRRDNGQLVTYDDFVKEDHVKILFYNRPYDPIVFTGPGRPFGEYLVTRYRIEWERLSGTDSARTVRPPTYYGATSISVPTDAFVEGYIVLVPYAVKKMQFLTEIQVTDPPEPRAGEEILCIAHITFWGHEVGTGRETHFTGQVSVNFADLVVKSKKEY
jgi:hypothetical protein